uniref:Solute carrier family 35 member E4 n=1 Tax=Geotrypetes seraphini TaxID=260995 RepID=A0A6P8S1T8_GEOSA|nr:solute carrier family 35 member E4 [Geotrypetes seraphini]
MACAAAVVVFTWLITGITISSLNKWIFAEYKFRCPLLLSSLHMLAAILLRLALLKLKAGKDGTLTAKARSRVFLLSLSFCASIAFGNLGLNDVQLSLAQMVYSTTPLFTLALSKALLGTQHHTLKYIAMVPICAGASLSMIGEAQFHRSGCIFLLLSTFLRGLKSIQQSTLLKEERINSVTLLYLMSLPSFCILFTAALVLENRAVWEIPYQQDNTLWLFILLSCVGSVLYNLASFWVIAFTSAVTIHVLGNLTMVGNLVLSQILFGSHLTGLSYVGIALTLMGMLLYHNCELIAGSLSSRTAKSK